MLPANRSPPMCVDSHVCSGTPGRAPSASGRPRSAQHGSRRPCVQTANSAPRRRHPDGAAAAERVEVERRHVATSSRSARSIHGRSGPVWIAKHAGATACGAPVATDQQDPDPQFALTPKERVAQAVGETRVVERPLAPRARVLHQEPVRDGGRGAEERLVGRFARVGAAERRVRHGHGLPQPSRRTGSATRSPSRTRRRTRTRRDAGSASTGVRSRTASVSDDATDRMAGSSHPGMSSRRSPSRTTSDPPRLRSSQTEPGRRASTVSSSIAWIACALTSTPRNSWARVDRNRGRGHRSPRRHPRRRATSASSPSGHATDRRTATDHPSTPRGAARRMRGPSPTNATRRLRTSRHEVTCTPTVR